MKPLKGFTLPTISRCGLRPLDIAGDVEPLRGSTSLFCWITVSLLRQDRLLDQFCRRIIHDQRLIFGPRLPRLRPQRRPVQVVRLAPASLALHGSQKSGLRRQVRRATRTRRRLEPHLLLAGELRDVIGRSIVREDDSQQLAFFVHSFHLIFGLLKPHPHTLPCPCSLSSIPLPILRLSIFSILRPERAKKLSIGVHGFAENRENRQPLDRERDRKWTRKRNPKKSQTRRMTACWQKAI